MLPASPRPRVPASLPAPLELAATDPVQQPPWDEYGMGGGETPIKSKYVSLHDGPATPEFLKHHADTLYFEAAPSPYLDRQARFLQIAHGLDYPHQIGFSRGEGHAGAAMGSFDVTGQGKAAQVLSHAAHAIKELARDYRPMDMHFTAAEGSRVRAYAHLMRRIVSDPELRGTTSV